MNGKRLLKAKSADDVDEGLVFNLRKSASSADEFLIHRFRRSTQIKKTGPVGGVKEKALDKKWQRLVKSPT
jgi:hypothetical protein